MDDSKSLKVRLTFCVLLVGVSLLFAAVVTDHWAVLSPKVENYNTTCEAAHFGLWRLCKKQIYVQQQGPKEKGCGPISLPGGTYSPPHPCTGRPARLCLGGCRTGRNQIRPVSPRLAVWHRAARCCVLVLGCGFTSLPSLSLYLCVVLPCTYVFESSAPVQ